MGGVLGVGWRRGGVIWLSCVFESSLGFSGFVILCELRWWW